MAAEHILTIALAFTLIGCSGEPSRNSREIRELREAEAIEQLVKLTGAHDDIRHRFKDGERVWTDQLQAALIDQSPHALLGSVLDIQKIEGRSQIVIGANLGGDFGPKMRFVLDATEEQIARARSDARPGIELQSLLWRPTHAVALNVTKLGTAQMPDEEGAMIESRFGQGQLLELIPIEDATESQKRTQ